MSRPCGLIAGLALACSAPSGQADPKPPPARAPISAPAATPGKPPAAKPPSGAAMDIAYQELPDDKWKQAAEVAVTAWREPLDKTMSARVVVRPWKSPDGAAVPYLLRLEATRSDGAPGFRATAAVVGGALANKGGAAGATRFLAAAGFPAHHISLGHLLDVLYVTGAVDVAWLAPPSVVGWDAVTRPDAATQQVPELAYPQDGAVLHLYRGAAAGGPGSAGGGFERPEVERLDVVFDRTAKFTTTVLRQDAARTRWTPVH